MTLISRLVAWKFKLPPAETYAISIQRDIPIPVPDGVNLLADRYYPTQDSQSPTILVRSPYGRSGFILDAAFRIFAERGFQVLVQSCRGTFGSGGDFYPFHHEREDGLATVAWLKAQPWFSGAFAMFGPSYLSYVQWAIADAAGPELKALVPIVTTAEFRSVTYPGESFALNTILFWAQEMVFQEEPPIKLILSRFHHINLLEQAYLHLPLSQTDCVAAEQTVNFYQDWLAHNTPGDPYWEQSDHATRIAQVTAPVNLICGWYDVLFLQTLACYHRLRAAGQNPYMTIGPWTHGASVMQPVMMNESLSWCRAYLLNDRDGMRKLPVRLYVMGAEEWREFEEWPPKGFSTQYWYLHAGGILSANEPADSPPDRYRYDPADPTPSVGGSSLSPNSGVRDNRKLEARQDILVYTSTPLERDLEVIGPLCVELFVKSSLQHTDFFARLCSVNPAGKSVNLSDGILRLIPGQPIAAEDGVLKVQIELWPTAHCFKKGYRIRLQVSSGSHPRFTRNPGSGEPLASATKLVAADQQVFHDPAHPSAIILPVKDSH
jgi:uncharacterized protein